MIAYVIQRLLQAVAVVLIVALIAFLLFSYVGDPVNNMVGQDATREDRAAIREALGLDDPLLLQFARYIGNALHGDFGVSLRSHRAVSTLIAERMPATLELVFVSAVLALTLGIGLGVFTGIRRYSWISRTILTVSLIGVSLPTFVIGIALIYLFSVTLGWLPSYGRGETVQVGFWTTGLLTRSGWMAILMPAVTLSLFQMTLILRLVRTEMLEVMRTDFIKFARARGLPNRAINFGHALKNTLVPVITIVGLNIGSLIAFSIVTETVFQWPGMGFLFIQSVQFADVPVMAAYLTLAALIFVTISFVVDLLYYVVDPRIRAAVGRGA